MSKKIASITLDEWLNNTFPKMAKPKNSFTIRELCEKTGICESTMRRKLKDMIASGEMIKGNFSQGGNIYTWYLPKEFYEK